MEIEARLEMQGDGRPFNTLQGIRPFPSKPKSKNEAFISMTDRYL
jgi:hypothetical protein